MTTNHGRPSMPDKLNKQGRQKTFRESDGCKVPMKPEDQSGGPKPGNAGVGKAARPSRDSDRTSPVLSDGHSVLIRLFRITHHWVTSDGWEPDALTAHVRIWEGPWLNSTWIQYCDTTRGNGWQTGNTNRNLNLREHGLLAPSRVAPRVRYAHQHLLTTG